MLVPCGAEARTSAERCGVAAQVTTSASAAATMARVFMILPRTAADVPDEATQGRDGKSLGDRSLTGVPRTSLGPGDAWRLHRAVAPTECRRTSATAWGREDVTSGTYARRMDRRAFMRLGGLGALGMAARGAPAWAL